jgi:parvulin-like peptidyl-prolyl isomerase
VGEFWQEFKELSAVFASKYQGVSGWKLLTERLIDRLLLLEDSSRKLPDTKDSIALEEAKLDVLSQMMEQEKVDDRIEITDQVLKTYYEKVKKDLIRPPQSQIRFIMFELGQSEDESNRACDRAKEAYELLNPGLFKEGANFAEVAREYSDDEISAEKGGLLEGWIGEGPDLFMEVGIHNFHQEVQSLDVGEIGRPFEWNGSVYIIQVMDRTEVEQLSFEEVKHYLSEELRSQKHKELRDELSLQLLEQYNVEFFVKELKSALDER